MPDTLVTKGADWKVRFAWSDREYIDAYFDGDRLVLHAGMFKGIEVRPVVANEITVKPVEL